MNRLLKTFFICLACAFGTFNAFSEKVIFEGITFPIFDQGDEAINMLLALGGSGKTQIVDVGEGYYLISMTIGKDPVITDLLINPKVVNSKLIQFKLASQPDFTVSITPEKIKLSDEVELGIYLASDFDNLYKNLSGLQVAQKPKGKADANSKELPSRGTLTPTLFSRHPFGFLPSNTRNLNLIEKQLKEAGWKDVKINEGNSSYLICIISSDLFRIPFKLYGKDVTIMSCWGSEISKIKTYDLEISDFKTNWSQNDANEFAQRIVNELVDAGYIVDHSETTLYGYDFFTRTLKGDGKEIKVTASPTSKFETLDAFGVRIDVRYQ